MRLTVCSIMLFLILLIPSKTLAYTAPKISDTPIFNETVEDVTSGRFSLNPISLINRFGELLTNEIKNSIGYVITIIFIALISGSVKVLSDSFSNETSKTVEFISFCVMSALSLKCFTMSMGYANDVVGAVSAFVNKLTPVFIMTLFACGSVVLGSAFSPVLSATVYVISFVIEKCLVPMITFSAVLSVVGNINDRVGVTNLCRVLKSLTKWIMVALITLFTTITALYGVSAPSLDALSAKAIKFAVGSTVPIVGNFLSDSLDTVLSGTRLVKNAVGVSGIITMCVICLVPILKVFVIQLVLKAGAALCEPVADKKISAMLWEVSDSILLIFAVLVMMMVMLMIDIGIILAVTGF
ncbi:MAG: stage III sporulation protein AE [Clostridia bacterium]|nr:stage III sporulation protein AE [Clostridia bacterium]